MIECGPKRDSSTAFSKRVAASLVVAAIATIVGPEFGIPRPVAPAVGFAGTMIISAAAQAAIEVKRVLRNK